MGEVSWKKGKAGDRERLKTKTALGNSKNWRLGRGIEHCKIYTKEETRGESEKNSLSRSEQLLMVSNTTEITSFIKQIISHSIENF